MSAGTTAQLLPAVTVPEGRSARAVTGHVARQLRTGALLVTVVAAGMTGLVALQYQTTFAGVLDSPSVQALAANPAIRTLFGPPVALDDPGGYTVWRTGASVAVLVAAWALLAATRLTRGEEDAGRWDLLLAGRVRRADLLGHCLCGLAAAALLVGAAMAGALLATGTQPTGALVHAVGVSGVGLGFAVLGVCAAQVMSTRAAATGVSAAALAAALLARMVADGVEALGWLRWLTPFGLLAQTRPYADNQLVPLLPLWLVPLVLGAGAVLAARIRDTGSGLLTGRAHRRPRTGLLHSVSGLAIRRGWRPLAGWAAAVTAYYLLIGSLTGSVTDFLTTNPRFAELAAQAGFGGLRVTAGYAAAMFTLLTLPAGIYGATRLAAAAADETSRRSVLIAAAPISRARLATTEITVAVAGVAVLHIVAALATWAGTAMAGVSLTLGAALAGALNGVPVALLGIAAAALAWGRSPHAVAAIGSLPVAGGFLLHVLAPAVGAPEWVARLSPYAYLAAVPDTPPDWAATIALTAIALALTAAGVLGYTRRDLAL